MAGARGGATCWVLLGTLCGRQPCLLLPVAAYAAARERRPSRVQRLLAGRWCGARHWWAGRAVESLKETHRDLDIFDILPVCATRDNRDPVRYTRVKSDELTG